MPDFETIAKELHDLVRETGVPSDDTFGLKLRIRRPKERFTLDYYEGVGKGSEKRQRIEVSDELVKEVSYYGEDGEGRELYRNDRFRDGVLVKLSQERDEKKTGSRLVRNHKKGYWRHRLKGRKSERLAELESDHFDILLGPAPGHHNDLTSVLAQHVRSNDELAELGKESRTFFEVTADSVKVTDDDRVEHTFTF